MDTLLALSSSQLCHEALPCAGTDLGPLIATIGPIPAVVAVTSAGAEDASPVIRAVDMA